MALHAVLVLPALAQLLTFTSWPADTRRKLVSAASAAYLTAAVGAGVWAGIQRQVPPPTARDFRGVRVDTPLRQHAWESFSG
ncbi:hypothetical protein [Streptomyces sp. NBC_01210]|uniref:hypothetical protein n=1 Tax=Streptomyces sp. NBC_01210 TaxID=2903774 RepID=UPI002E13464F